eukprot:gene5430-3915_t
MKQTTLFSFQAPAQRKRLREDEAPSQAYTSAGSPPTPPNPEESPPIIPLESTSSAVLERFSEFEQEFLAAISRADSPVAKTMANMFLDGEALDTAHFERLWPPKPGSGPDAVPYSVVVDTLVDISGTSSRLECVLHLTRLLLAVLRRAPQDLISVLYLVINKQAPAHEGVELGVGDSFLVKAVAESCGMTEARVKELYRNTGDLAEVAQNNKQRQLTLVQPAPLKARQVYATFRTVAEMQGKDVVRRRLDIIKRLLTDAKGPEVNIIVRALQQKMRIGLAESSALTAMGYAFVLHFMGETQVKRMTPEQLQGALTLAAAGLARAFAEVPSLNVVIQAVLDHGFMILVSDSTVAAAHPGALSIRPGLPVRPQLATPTNGVGMIFQRFQGKRFTSEYKYDGERAQIHYNKSQGFHIFSRNSETQTSKYPDLISLLPRLFNDDKVESFIIDSEVVAVNPESGALQAFQVLQHRGRKNIEEDNISIPVCIFAFDILYLNGEPQLHLPLVERRKLLHENFSPIPSKMAFATSMDSDDVEDIEKFLEQSIADGCEGLMVKTLVEEACYTPAKRSHYWLKLKKDYMDGVTDTLDLVPIGAYYGKGKRAGVFGGFLMACYDPENDEYQSICKIGTGFQDEVLEAVTRLLQPLVVEEKPGYYRTNDKAEIWLRDGAVWEVKAADLSISPVHCAALGLVDSGRGVALRFPRYIRTREDKKPSDATTAEQVAQMYRSQSLAIQQNPDGVEED